MGVAVFYKCDRKACGENHDCGECRRTHRIEHAVNFEKKQHIYIEKYSEDEKRKEPDCIEDTDGLTINDLP